jgi:hypothetical protein
MSCADLDHLVLLPSGDAALTRRARAASRLSAVVVRFSRARKRYERRGVLVEEAALTQAEEQCLADQEARARRRDRDAVRRAACGVRRRMSISKRGWPLRSFSCFRAVRPSAQIRSRRMPPSAGAGESGAVLVGERSTLGHSSWRSQLQSGTKTRRTTTCSCRASTETTHVIGSATRCGASSKTGAACADLASAFGRRVAVRGNPEARDVSRDAFQHLEDGINLLSSQRDTQSAR